MTPEDQYMLATTEELIEEARAGRMFILVDDEDRENEGDLVIPAQMATPDAINFMAKHGRGLICLAMDSRRAEQLGLHLMPQSHNQRRSTAFTVSIEAREGISTGISAADRAHTVQVAIDPTKDRRDISTPGHVFPVLARDGGVLVRAGHTEAAVDISRLAGMNPSGVICEVMGEDGTMARLPELIAFAQLHGLKIGTIADMIAYRRRTETLVERKLETTLESRYGGAFRVVLYVNRLNYAEHLALVKGDLTAPGPVPVRMHALSLLDDVLGDVTSGRGGDLQHAMELIGQEDRGVVVLIREPLPTSLSDRLKARVEGDKACAGAAGLRDYGIGAQILLDLGVREMTLLTNAPKNVVGLDGYGLKITGLRPLR